MKNNFIKILSIFSLALILFSCQNMDRPELGDYPKDAAPVGGPLKFFVAFDGTTTNPLMNAVDSVRAKFPQDNPLSSTDGVSGKAMLGANKKFIKYAKPNDWASTAQSFTVSFWAKGNGQTKNNNLTNGPEYIFSIPTTNGHWSGGQAMLMFEGDNTACAIKFVIVDKNMSDPWLTWEGGNSIAGLRDNQWHHYVFVYDAATSKMTLYKDGVANPNTPSWSNHGNLNMNEATISSFRIGCGPGNNMDSDDWLSSTWKGSIDQFRMYGVALSATDINKLYTKKR